MKTNITLKTINELVNGIKDLGNLYIDLHRGEDECLYWFIDKDGIHFNFDFTYYGDVECWCGMCHDDLVLTYRDFVNYLKDPCEYFKNAEAKKKRWEEKQYKLEEKRKKQRLEDERKATQIKERKERELYEKLKLKYESK